MTTPTREAAMRILLALFIAALPAPPAGANWPHWRGPTRDDRTDEPSGWAGGKWLAEEPAWTAKVGGGASSPLVVGGHVYAFGRDAGGDVLRCLDARDGREVWAAKSAGPAYGRFHNGDEGFYSGPSSTPEFDPATNLLYTLGPDGDLRCRDAATRGKEVWAVNLYDAYAVKQRPRVGRSPLRDYGFTSSPLVSGDRLIVEVGSERGTLVAFDKRTGQEAWRSELTDEPGHTAGPVPMTVEGVPCVAVLTLRNLAVVRLDAGNEGKTVATFPWATDFANNVASPAVRGDCVLVTSAYNMNAICKLRVTLAGATELWRKRFPSKVCTPVIVGGYVYLAWQRVRCLDWETGEQQWEGGAFGDAGSCVATADGRLVVYGGSGKLALVEGAGRSPKAYTELAARGPLFGAVAWPHVVLAGGRVLCRDREGNLACFRVGN